MPVQGHTTRAPYTVLTAAIYNVDHELHIGNAQYLDAAKPDSVELDTLKVLTQAEYDGISTPSANTLYIIID